MKKMTVSYKMLSFCTIYSLKTLHYIGKMEGNVRLRGYSNLPVKLKAYNTQVRQKEILQIKHPGMLSWYLCGPTVYDSAHIGHACCYVKFDIIRRILTDVFHVNVVQVMGVTDIDDKIIIKAKQTGTSTTQLTRQYEDEFLEDMANLGVRPPSIIARVTQYVSQIVEFIRVIVDRELAYVSSEGSVYFDVQRYGRYGKLLTIPDLMGEESEKTEKRSPRDFALWKASKPGEPWWESPWGMGRPGWHIECSAMASEVFGSHLDLHTGGWDLLFPHHENEEAQCCAFHDIPQWVSCWLHTGHLILKDDVKMSKSLGNTMSIPELLNRFTPDQFRMFCLLSHYRSNMEFSDNSLEAACGYLHKFQSFFQTCQDYKEGQMAAGRVDESRLLKKIVETEENVRESLADDFNTPIALAHLLSLVSTVNKMIGSPNEGDPRNAGAVVVAEDVVRRYLSRLGLSVDCKTGVESLQLPRVLDSCLEMRRDVRFFATRVPPDVDKKEWKRRTGPLLDTCDKLRDHLKNAGITVRDHEEKSSWSLTNPAVKEIPER